MFFKARPLESTSRKREAGLPARSQRRQRLRGTFDDGSKPIKPFPEFGESFVGLLTPLAAVEEGDSVVVAVIKGPRGIALRLAAFGLMPGTNVKMLRNSLGNGPLLLEIGSTKLGLAKSICMGVLTGEAATLPRLDAGDELPPFDNLAD